MVGNAQRTSTHDWLDTLRDPDWQIAAGGSVGGDWPVPRGGRLDGESLIWEPAMVTDRLVTAAPGLIEEFVRLDSPSAIATFGKAWGPLGLCDQHGLPGSHRWQERRRREPPCGPLRAEPIERWREWIARAAAVLRLATAMYEGGLGDNLDWQAIGHPTGLDAPAGVPLEYSAAFRVTAELNSWIVMGDVRPRLWWIEVGRSDMTRRPVVIKGAGLFGALAYQLLLAAGRSPGLARCTICGREFDHRQDRSRRPQAGRAIYCSEPCQREGARRRAERSRHTRAAV